MPCFCLPGNAFIDYISEVSRKLWAKKAYFIITFTKSVGGGGGHSSKFPVVRNSILTPLTQIRLGGGAPSHVFRFWSATAKWLKQLSWNFETFYFTFELCAYFTLCTLSLEHLSDCYWNYSFINLIALPVHLSSLSAVNFNKQLRGRVDAKITKSVTLQESFICKARQQKWKVKWGGGGGGG